MTIARPVWSHDGGVCTGESYKRVVKLTFFRGASIEDPKKLFNSSLEGNTRRAIDIRRRLKQPEQESDARDDQGSAHRDRGGQSQRSHERAYVPLAFLTSSEIAGTTWWRSPITA